MRNLEGKVTVIMPAYNEDNHIITSIQETIDTFNQFGCEYKIIVMDDGSQDDTYQKTRNFAAGHLNVCVKKIKLISGKAFRHATGNYVLFLDSDLDLHRCS